ncbi:MAG TPA: hypothetical protein VGR81_08705 [Candidatus Acidoferrales bacterium]|nr:hypothetical protein [Candidatus Acidoferrales bacterium]
MRVPTKVTGHVRHFGKVLRSMFPPRPKQIPAQLWNELLWFSRNTMPAPARWRAIAIALGQGYGITERDLENAGIIPRKPVTEEQIVRGK